MPNSRGLFFTPAAEEVEPPAIPADCIVISTYSVTLKLFFPTREQAREAGETARRHMKDGRPFELFEEYMRRIQETVSFRY
jgi:hypothetical protein